MNPGAIRRSSLPNPQIHTFCNKPVRLETKIALTAFSLAATGTVLALAITGFTLTPYLLIGPVVGAVVGIAMLALKKTPVNTPMSTPNAASKITDEQKEASKRFRAEMEERMANLKIQEKEEAIKAISSWVKNPADSTKMNDGLTSNSENPNYNGVIIARRFMHFMERIDWLNDNLENFQSDPYGCVKEEYRDLLKNFFTVMAKQMNLSDTAWVGILASWFHESLFAQSTTLVDKTTAIKLTELLIQNVIQTNGDDND
jgi:hypothetical protein